MSQPIPPPENTDQEHFDEIERLLDITYGPRLLRTNGDPVSELVGTILSQNTSDVNTARTFASLRERFPTWEDVIEADTTDVRDAIRTGGLSNIKAPRIQKVLQAIQERQGELNLDFLASMSVEDGQKWLTELDGIGPKTAACVLLFSLGLPAMPVDTHVGRVMTRLGVVPDRTSTLRKERIIESFVGEDADRMYAVHVETITHGRQICKAQRPLCDICPLQHICLYYQERIA
ncbi:MAG: endonuclease III [Thermomicrobiales bacterium]|nr:endonuclease III [Thermomicrobiales bacterium]